MAGNKFIVSLMLITLVALAGCSDDSNPVATPAPAPSVDTAPPAPAAGLQGSYLSALNVVTISWAANTTDADLDGYLISRENDGTTVDLVSDPLKAQTFTDQSPLAGMSIYHVTAVDEAGNESAVSSVSVNYSVAAGRDELGNE